MSPTPVKSIPATSIPVTPIPLPQHRQVGIGCIGAGFIMADCHLAAYQQIGLQPVAISSRTLSRAQEVAARFGITRASNRYQDVLNDPRVEVLDVAVPPDIQFEIITEALRHRQIRGILAQKPLAVDYGTGLELVRRCAEAGVTLAVNQNMRFDPAVRTCQTWLQSGELGEPVLATIDMRAIPHWMPWQERLGWLTLRMMSIHHLDTFRYWLGDPQRVFTSTRPDPRTAHKFPHEDGICLTILEYHSGLRALSLDDVWAGPAREGAAADLGIQFRIEGTTGMAQGMIGWPKYPARVPSTLAVTSIARGPQWSRSNWPDVWFPDAFAGPMSELLLSLEQQRPCLLSGADHLRTLAIVEAGYRSAREHRAVELAEILEST